MFIVNMIYMLVACQAESSFIAILKLPITIQIVFIRLENPVLVLKKNLHLPKTFFHVPIIISLFGLNSEWINAWFRSSVTQNIFLLFFGLCLIILEHVNIIVMILLVCWHLMFFAVFTNFSFHSLCMRIWFW